MKFCLPVAIFIVLIGIWLTFYPNQSIQNLGAEIFGLGASIIVVTLGVESYRKKEEARRCKEQEENETRVWLPVKRMIYSRIFDATRTILNVCEKTVNYEYTQDKMEEYKASKYRIVIGEDSYFLHRALFLLYKKSEILKTAYINSNALLDYLKEYKSYLKEIYSNLNIILDVYGRFLPHDLFIRSVELQNALFRLLTEEHAGMPISFFQDFTDEHKKAFLKLLTCELRALIATALELQDWYAKNADKCDCPQNERN